MKHYLVRTLLYGVGAGTSVALAAVAGIGSYTANYFYLLLFSMLFLLILVGFFITEILPRKNSASPEARSQRWNKLWLFLLLAVSGVGIMSIWATIELFSPNTDPQGAIFLLVCCPIDFIYITIAIGVLLRLFARRLPKVSSVESSTRGD